MKPSKKTTYEVHELIAKRWSPRAFDTKDIEQGKINSLFEAARWAASAMNEQPWNFIFATRKDQKKYNDIFSCLAEGNQVWAKNSPLLIITFINTRYKRNNKINNWAIHDLGLAIGNLTIQATAHDLYVHNMAGFSPEKVKQLFDIPEYIEPVTVIAVGYLGNPESLPDDLKERELADQVRKPFKDLFLG
ncbi:nitroreductase family protein [Bacteroidota bacterium]